VALLAVCAACTAAPKLQLPTVPVEHGGRNYEYPEEDRPGLVLRLDADGELSLAGVPVALDGIGPTLAVAVREHARKRESEGKEPWEMLPRDDDGTVLSPLWIELEADRRTPWRYVRTFLEQAGREGIYKVALAFEYEGGAHRHLDRVLQVHLGETTWEGAQPILVRLRREPSGALKRMFDWSPIRSQRQFEEHVKARVRAIRVSPDADAYALLDCGSDLAFEHVFDTVRWFREAGVEAVDFTIVPGELTNRITAQPFPRP